MIETLIINYLESELNVPVSAEEPEDKSGRYIVIEKTSGGMADQFVPEAAVAIQSYADTLFDAAQLNELVKEAMENIINLDEISLCQLNNDYNFTDTTTKRYRYQAIYDLVLFG